MAGHVRVHMSMDASIVTRCGDTRRAEDPARVVGGQTLALTLSGGGFRATLAAAGVVRALADAGKLSSVRFISSVSGGSITNAMLATRWDALKDARFSAAAVDEQIVDPLVKSIAGSSMKVELLRNAWRAVGPRSRTDVLAHVLDQRFFGGDELEHLTDDARFVFNAANLRTGVRFAFERDVVGDYVTGLASTRGTGLRVAQAVAASAAVPGAFAPMRLRGVTLPCTQSGAPRLVDGGAYDNSGLEPFSGSKYADLMSVSLNAGGLLRTGGYGRVPILRDLMRSNSLLYRQSTGLRTRLMVERFRAWETAGPTSRPEWARRGVLVQLSSEFNEAAVEPWRTTFPEHRKWRQVDAADVPTVFDKLDEGVCRLLVYRGWWLTGAVLATYQPDHAVSLEVAPPQLVSGR